MTRTLKVVILALVAVCAMSAMIASAASAASFTSTSYPSTLTGEGGIGAAEKFTLGPADHNLSIECKRSSYHGTQKADSSTRTVSPHYTECTAFGGLSAAFSMEECVYVFHATSTSSSTVDIACPFGKSIKIIAGTCEVDIGSHAGLKSAGLANSIGHVNVTLNLSGIFYTRLKDGFLCPLTGTGTQTGATITTASPITFKGSFGAISVS